MTLLAAAAFIFLLSVIISAWGRLQEPPERDLAVGGKVAA
jgi:hypothetical protein